MMSILVNVYSVDRYLFPICILQGLKIYKNIVRIIKYKTFSFEHEILSRSHQIISDIKIVNKLFPTIMCWMAFLAG